MHRTCIWRKCWSCGHASSCRVGLVQKAAPAPVHEGAEAEQQNRYRTPSTPAANCSAERPHRPHNEERSGLAIKGDLRS